MASPQSEMADWRKASGGPGRPILGGFEVKFLEEFWSCSRAKKIEHDLFRSIEKCHFLVMFWILEGLWSISIFAFTFIYLLDLQLQAKMTVPLTNIGWSGGRFNIGINMDSSSLFVGLAVESFPFEVTTKPCYQKDRRLN